MRPQLDYQARLRIWVVVIVAVLVLGAIALGIVSIVFASRSVARQRFCFVNETVAVGHVTLDQSERTFEWLITLVDPALEGGNIQSIHVVDGEAEQETVSLCEHTCGLSPSEGRINEEPTTGHGTRVLIGEILANPTRYLLRVQRTHESHSTVIWLRFAATC